MIVASASQQCLVCSAPITSVHLGMDICRACACFFKRSKTMGRQYPCRLGDGNCSIAKDGKFACRGCRLDKCIEVGLAYDGPLRVRKKFVSILQRIKMETRSCLERRRELELDLIISHGGHKRYPDLNLELYEMHPGTIMQIYRVSIEESYVFFRNTFPAFSQINSTERMSIFKDYVGKLGLLEGYHRSQQIWHGINRKMVCSVTTYCDLGQYEMCNNPFSMVGYAKSTAAEQNDVFLAVYNKCSITDREYHALIGLIMSELDRTCEISEEAQVILDQYRHEILQDLQLYYRNELGLKDFSTRLGNLMTLNHAMQECKSLMKGFFTFYTTIFDVFMANNLIKEFFL